MTEPTYPSLRACLEAEKLTQAQFAQEFGISQPTVSSILNGQTQPSTELLLRILAKYSIDPQSFRRRSSTEAA